MNYNEMHPPFWNSLTLTDRNFGTKSLIDLKKKKKTSLDFAVLYYAIISVLVELNFGIQSSYTPLKNMKCTITQLLQSLSIDDNAI